jgi:hypothetical protein
MTTRKRWAVTGAILTGLGLAAFLVLYGTVLAPRLSRGDYARVRMGMTRGEVENILGPPFDDDALIGLLSKGVHIEMEESGDEPAAALAGWTEEERSMLVRYSTRGKVVGKSFLIERRQSLLERLRAWLGV